jgi:hypothetical protein
MWTGDEMMWSSDPVLCYVLEKEAETSDMYATVTEYESDGNGDDNGKR